MFLPQMSPMWWTILMIMFCFMIFMCMYMVYFNYNKKMTDKMKINPKNMYWMW